MSPVSVSQMRGKTTFMSQSSSQRIKSTCIFKTCKILCLLLPIPSLSRRNDSILRLDESPPEVGMNRMWF